MYVDLTIEKGYPALEIVVKVKCDRV
jgi:hypothetical protein